MAILPDFMREEIMDLFDRGYTNQQIFEKISSRSDLSDNVLMRCIVSLKGKSTFRRRKSSEQTQFLKPTGFERQNRKENYLSRGLSSSNRFSSTNKKGHFNAAAYSGIRQNIIEQGNNYTATEPYHKQIAKDILEDLEGFESIISGPSVQEYKGTPFDLFGTKGGEYSIIELKGSLNRYNLPDSTQLVRMEDLLSCLSDRKISINPYLLQINLNEGSYCLRGEVSLRSLFQGKDKSLGKFTPITPIADWIIDRINATLVLKKLQGL